MFTNILSLTSGIDPWHSGKTEWHSGKTEWLAGKTVTKKNYNDK